MSVSAVLVLDLRGERARRRRAWQTLADAPAGALIEVEVGATRPDPDAAWLLAEHAERLHLRIRGTDAAALAGWVRAVEAGPPPAAASPNPHAHWERMTDADIYPERVAAGVR